MIFVTVGSQKFQFNRLLKEVDSLIEKKQINENVFAQTGYSDYRPVGYEYKAFLDRNAFFSKIDQSDIVITHGGTGVIVESVKRCKKVIAIPRRAHYGEHVDDHQLQIIEQFGETNLICACEKIEKLGESLQIVRKTEYDTYKSNTKNVIRSIEALIDSWRI